MVPITTVLQLLFQAVDKLAHPGVGGLNLTGVDDGRPTIAHRGLGDRRVRAADRVVSRL